MKKITKLLMLPFLLLTSCLSLASPTSSGIYLDANFGLGYADVLNIFGDGSLSKSGGFAGNTNLGYQFNNMIALEAGFSAYSDLSLTNKNAYTNHVAAKVMIPFTDRFNIFFKLGGGLIYAQGDGSTSHGGLFYGAGLALSITDQLDVNIQTSGVTQFADTLGLYSAGLTYHFKW